MKYRILTLIIFVSGLIKAQQTNEPKINYPVGEAYSKVFSNFHVNFTETEPEYKFELTRAYLGYKCKFNEYISGNVCVDAGNPGNKSNLEQMAYFKYAALVYEKNDFNFTFGLIGLEHFFVQEKFWGYRYIYKTFLDQNNLSQSADLGATIKYKINSKIGIDATLRNGEGYKKIQSDNTLRVGFGLTAEPVKNLTVRAYYDIYQKGITQNILTGFAGYKIKDYGRFGVEYNYVMNNNWQTSQNLSGVSFLSAFSLNKKIELFGRYDNLISNKLTDELNTWNYSNDGQTIIGGIQYKIAKNISSAIDFQGFIHDDKSISKKAVYLNFEYVF